MKTKYMDLIFTNHAINRLYNRGLTQSDAWYTFRHPDGSLPGQTLGSQKFFKNFGDQRIGVVAKKNEKGEWVALSCWSKYIGNGKPIFPQKENLFWGLTKKIVRNLWNKIQKK